MKRPNLLGGAKNKGKQMKLLLLQITVLLNNAYTEC